MALAALTVPAGAEPADRPNRAGLEVLVATIPARVNWIEALRIQPLEPCLPAATSFHGSTVQIESRQVGAKGETTNAQAGRGTGGPPVPRGMHPATLVTEMRRRLPEDTTLFLDSGIHRLYAYHYWQTHQVSGVITAAKSAPTGWAIAAAIGAAFTRRFPRLAVLTGDACMLMHGVELSTAAKYGVRVLFIVSNNGVHGSIHQRFVPLCPAVENLTRTPSVDWVAFARSLGVPGGKATQISELSQLLDAARQANGPFLIEAITLADDEVPAPKFIFSACSEAVLRRFSDASVPPDSRP
jgi:thiamine pyrophosphate-dependent acetolactate synthase large subunit-like protein